MNVSYLRQLPVIQILRNKRHNGRCNGVRRFCIDLRLRRALDRVQCFRPRCVLVHIDRHRLIVGRNRFQQRFFVANLARRPHSAASLMHSTIMLVIVVRCCRFHQIGDVEQNRQY